MAKHCPTCKSQQPDTLEFCPLDGARLEVDAAVATVGRPQASSSAQRSPSQGLMGDGPSAMVAAAESQVGANHHRPTLLAIGPVDDGLATRVHPSAPPVMVPPPRGQAPVPAGPAPTAPSSLRGPSGAVVPTAVSATATGGSTFADALRRAPLPVDAAVARIAALADAVHAQRSPLHGALTPWHVGFASTDASGAPTIAAPEAVTDPQQLAPYRAPELESGDVLAYQTPVSEVYALGCMLFQALVGRPPFEGKTPQDLARRHANFATPALRMVKRDVDLPPAVELELQRALKKRPGDRHPSAAAFAQAIRAANRDDDRSTMSLKIGAQETLEQAVKRASQGIPAGTQGSAPARAAAADVAAAKPAPIQEKPAAAAPSGSGPASGPVLGPASAPSDVDAAPTPASKVPLAVGAVIVVALLVGIGWFLLADRASAPAPVTPTPAVVDVADVAAPPDVADVVDAADAEDSADTVDTADTEDADAADEQTPDVPAEPAGKPRAKAKAKATTEQPKTEEPKKKDGPAVF